MKTLDFVGAVVVRFWNNVLVMLLDLVKSGLIPQLRW